MQQDRAFFVAGPPGKDGAKGFSHVADRRKLIHWQTVASAHTSDRADGHVQPLVPHWDVFCMRQQGRGDDDDP